MSRWHAAALAALLLTASAAWAQPLPLRYRDLPLNPDDPAQTRIGRLDYCGGFELRAEDEDFGGLSGLAWDAAENRLIGVTDRGGWWIARPSHDGQGRMIGLGGSLFSPMLGRDGRPLAGRMADAEAVSRALDGSYVVAFERVHRLWRYGPGLNFQVMRPTPIPHPPGIEAAPANGGIEAFAVLADGRMLAAAEELRDAAGDHQGWVFEGGAWHPLGLVPVGQFRPTDLAALPNGDAVLLERRFTTVGGFGARLSRLRGGAMRPGARLAGEELARIERPLQLGNFEALAARPMPDGGVTLYLGTDDNFTALLRTLLLCFRLPAE
ncbi:MAG: esterase-like activity of phytase family protein [Alphaproteobacteria bacterium]|nr:esterase-like activity of phytase family protein [Alphaproteobacteria bacterium]